MESFIETLTAAIAKDGAWAAMTLMIGLGAFWLVRWTLAENAKRELATNKMIEKRESESRMLLTQQMAVINQQCQTLDSQSQALNRLTDRIESFGRAIEQTEQAHVDCARRHRSAAHVREETEKVG